MATDVFPVYEILVENIFGGMALAVVGVGIVLLLIMLMTRVSKEFIFYWLMIYFITLGTFSYGALGIVMGFIFSLLYFAFAFLRSFLGGTVNI